MRGGTSVMAMQAAVGRRLTLNRTILSAGTRSPPSRSHHVVLQSPGQKPRTHILIQHCTWCTSKNAPRDEVAKWVSFFSLLSSNSVEKKKWMTSARPQHGLALSLFKVFSAQPHATSSILHPCNSKIHCALARKATTIIYLRS